MRKKETGEQVRKQWVIRQAEKQWVVPRHTITQKGWKETELGDTEKLN